MKEIKPYTFFWRPDDNQGSLHLTFSEETGANTLLDSPAEASLLVDVLRNEKPCYFNVASPQISTGLEEVE